MNIRHISTIFKNDYILAAGFVLIAFLVRVPFISYPPEPVWDEFHYANYAIRTLNGEGAIDVHPPFMRLFFAKAAELFGFDDYSLKINIGEGFDSFPYAALRFLSVVAGSLLAGIVYLIAKKIFENKILAALPPFFIIFDGFLITYSRLILPEIFILFFGFLGILFLISGPRFLLIFSGISLGIASSVKWSGLGFLTAGVIYLILNKKIKYASLLILISLLTYFYIFSLVVPPNEFMKYSKAMYQGHLAFKEGEISYASHPIKWPFADDQFILWGNGRNDVIRTSPNLFSWTLVVFSFLTSVYLLYRKRERKLLFLMAGYLANYLPFFFISRPLFLYHYIISLVFGFLIAPYSVSLLVEVFGKDREKKIIATILLANAVFFLIFIPFIY